MTKNPVENNFGVPLILVIRFSSLGDIVQGLGVPFALKSAIPNAKVHWLTREDFSSLLNKHPSIEQVIAFPKKEGFWGLIQLAWQLGDSNYTHVYDAHNNIRSHLVTLILSLRAALGRCNSFEFTRRPKNRLKRWLFFKFRIPTFAQPFRGAESFLWPLLRWNVSSKVPPAPQFFVPSSSSQILDDTLKSMKSDFIALAPSAAWEMKRWPIDHWKKLIALLEEQKFVVLGGPQDRFCEEFAQAFPDRAYNLAGKLSLLESAALISRARLVISGDTGMLHIADQLGIPTLALIGPTAFGYPSQASSETIEIQLDCKPCSKDGRGRCRNSVYQRCLVEISPEQVAEKAQRHLKKSLNQKGDHSCFAGST